MLNREVEDEVEPRGGEAEARRAAAARAEQLGGFGGGKGAMASYSTSSSSRASPARCVCALLKDRAGAELCTPSCKMAAHACGSCSLRWLVVRDEPLSARTRSSATQACAQLLRGALGHSRDFLSCREPRLVVHALRRPSCVAAHTVYPWLRGAKARIAEHLTTDVACELVRAPPGQMRDVASALEVTFTSLQTWCCRHRKPISSAHSARRALSSAPRIVYAEGYAAT